MPLHQLHGLRAAKKSLIEFSRIQLTVMEKTEQVNPHSSNSMPVHPPPNPAIKKHDNKLLIANIQIHILANLDYYYRLNIC